MILRRLILLAILVAGLAVSGMVVIIGLIYALYALMEPTLGAAGSTATVFGLFALSLAGGAGALFAMSRARGPAVAPTPAPTVTIVDRLSDLVRDRPFTVMAAAVGAGVLAIRNPRYLGSAIRAFAAPRRIED